MSVTEAMNNRVDRELRGQGAGGGCSGKRGGEGVSCGC